MWNTKRSLAVLTAGMMCLMGTAAVVPENAVQRSVLTASAEDASTNTLGSLTYVVRDNHIAITSFDNSETDAVIPEEIDGLPVEEIGEYAFQGAAKLKSVEIPSCVTTIGDGAFKGCISLENLVLPEDLTSLGVYVFENCTSLKSAWFLFGPSYIPEGTFKNCGALNDVHFSIAVTSFYSQDGYDDVEASDIFYGCDLQHVYYAGTETQWEAIKNNWIVQHKNTRYFGATVARLKTAGDLTYAVADDHVTIMGVDKSAKEVNIPAELDGLPVTRIDEGAFRDANRLVTVSIPEGVTEIAGHAFRDCTKLKEIKLPESLETIGYMAFAGCTMLPMLRIPSGVTSIGSCAFQGCVSLKSLYFPEDLEAIGIYACENCSSLETVYFPNGPSYISEGVFKNCGALKDVYFSTLLTKLYSKDGYDDVESSDIFYGCSLQNVYYDGTETQWNAIVQHWIVKSNEFHYNTPVPERSGSDIAPEPTTEPPTTEPPTTEPPTTEPPTTESPTTEPSTTEPPASQGKVNVKIDRVSVTLDELKQNDYQVPVYIKMDAVESSISAIGFGVAIPDCSYEVITQARKAAEIGGDLVDFEMTCSYSSAYEGQAWLSWAASAPRTEGGNLALLNVQIPEDAKVGSLYPIHFSDPTGLTTWANTTDNIYYTDGDVSYSEGYIEIVSGEVSDVLYGDVNGDAGVDILDVIALNKYLLGSATLTPQGKINADVDLNKELDSTDSLNILKFVVKLGNLPV